MWELPCLPNAEDFLPRKTGVRGRRRAVRSKRECATDLTNDRDRVSRSSHRLLQCSTPRDMEWLSNDECAGQAVEAATRRTPISSCRREGASVGCSAGRSWAPGSAPRPERLRGGGGTVWDSGLPSRNWSEIAAETSRGAARSSTAQRGRRRHSGTCFGSVGQECGGACRAVGLGCGDGGTTPAGIAAIRCPNGARSGSLRAACRARADRQVVRRRDEDSRLSPSVAPGANVCAVVRQLRDRDACALRGLPWRRCSCGRA